MTATIKATMSQANINTNTTTNPYSNGSTNDVRNSVGGVVSSADTNNSGIAMMSSTAAQATTNMNSNNMQSGSTNNFNQTHNSSNSNNNNISNINGHHHRAITEHVKRKKFKSRNATMPVSDGYFKDHLDAWLETCLKDASNTQLSSSSEFLDFNPTSTANKNSFVMHSHQQHQQKHQQQQHHPHRQQQQRQQREHHQQHAIQTHQLQQQQQNTTHSNYLQHATQHRPQKIPQQQFTANSATTQALPNGYNVPFSQSFQRSMPNYMKQSTSAFNNRFSLNFPLSSTCFPQTDGSQDFASLPPIVNMLGGVGSAEHDNNSTDVLDGSACNPNISRGFRFSDPCLLNPSDNDSKTSEQNPTTMPNDMENNKFFAALMEQINLLHETNSKIFRNLHETKVDIEALKHTPHWGGMRHRRDSLSGLSTHSQPMIFGGGFSAHSPASTYQSGSYAPGMMTDVVREVKEAARVREDALLNRVKALVEERQWSLNECNLRIMRDIEELKSQVHNLRVERKEANKRINHLETENKYMRQMLATLLNNQRQTHEVTFETDTLRPRKPFPNARRTQSMNLHYGTVHQQPQTQTITSSLSVEEETDEALHIIETPSTTSTADIAGLSKIAHRIADKRHSLSSSDSGGASSNTGAYDSNGKTVINGVNKNAIATAGQIPSPPSFALVSTPIDALPNEKTTKSIEKQIDLSNAPANKKIQNDLKEAVAARKEADKRIIALEKLVTDLRVHSHQPIAIDGDGTNYGVGYTNTTSAMAAQVVQMTGASIAAPKRNKQKSSSVLMNSSCNKNIANKQPQSQQQQQQQQLAHASNGYNKSYSPTRLSVAGPITDL